MIDGSGKEAQISIAQRRGVALNHKQGRTCRCSLPCLAVAQTVSSPAGSLYDSPIGLQRFPSEQVCPWQHAVKLQRGNFRVKMPD
ncbi:hypothetical protein Q8A67_025503 [Cirrhinus molitorella]|uniref:Uncharacterized protein n=1 Tax=Cirrhinus molitorella TaxID=172907 RepID=A0AA88T7D7_9TELE|nr:hypothetical protein Q8A67_025503 [Cirrhinus molitorella]